MSNEAKRFIFALECCREAGGMEWRGKLPDEIVKLFDLQVNSTTSQYNIAGMTVYVVPQYMPVQRKNNE